MAPVKYFFIGAGLLMSAMADYVAFTEWPASLTAGQPVTLKWVGGGDAPFTITLRKGASTDLHDVQVLTTAATNGEYTWTPPRDLQNANDYAFQISQGDQINYTGLLPLSGGSDTPNANSLDGTQTDAANLSNSASATETAAAASSLTESAATAAASATGTIAGATTTATDSAASATSAATGSATTTGGTSASEEGASATASSVSTETALASKMNTPFVGSHMATPTTAASSSVQTGSAGRVVVVVPLALLASSAAFLFVFV
ncbi:extracellular matrix protein, putative [Talaromyces stipitatus ATCC 10500]|uniref:Extracellular matrix protein, putative n=1 Tax=Talaromyces stipitatus (strain ATCC 10500 / CBS 375.48 / QM 6759 / NRRL 1006) TaxID=441959 RepID=B8MQJ5_TALSN|nr:extracellular matrix protein, putative [Talaromyces stipitatus ATCC 10500]EED13397.1 extracellular matrix protein, putative [Talaromyces stipitatus ATCC 10500]